VGHPVADDAGPRWLRTLSDANPFKHAVDAVRALFRRETGGSAIGWVVVSVVALVAVSLWLGARTFRAEAGRVAPPGTRGPAGRQPAGEQG